MKPGDVGARQVLLALRRRDAGGARLCGSRAPGPPRSRRPPPCQAPKKAGSAPQPACLPTPKLRGGARRQGGRGAVSAGGVAGRLAEADAPRHHDGAVQHLPRRGAPSAPEGRAMRRVVPLRRVQGATRQDEEPGVPPQLPAGERMHHEAAGRLGGGPGARRGGRGGLRRGRVRHQGPGQAASGVRADTRPVRPRQGADAASETAQLRGQQGRQGGNA